MKWYSKFVFKECQQLGEKHVNLCERILVLSSMLWYIWVTIVSKVCMRFLPPNEFDWLMMWSCLAVWDRLVIFYCFKDPQTCPTCIKTISNRAPGVKRCVMIFFFFENETD